MQVSNIDQGEASQIQLIKEKYKDQLGEFEIFPIEENNENLGFILKNSSNLPTDGDWILSDLDDTLIGTQEAKPQRVQLFLIYFKSLGLDLSKEQVISIINITDAFARWQEADHNSKNLYHPIAHMVAIQEIVDALIKNKKQEVVESTKDVLSEIYKKLNRIKSQLSENAEPQIGDPFRFSYDKKLVVRKKSAWSNDIANIFKQSMITPPVYEKNLSAITEEGEEVKSFADSLYSVNKGILTSGIPSYQLNKIGELLKEHPEINFNILILTKNLKEEILRIFIKLEKIRNKTIVVYDDAIDNVKEIREMGEEEKIRTGNNIIGIVAKTPYAKDVGKNSSEPTINYVTSDVDDIRETFANALSEGEVVRSNSD